MRQFEPLPRSFRSSTSPSFYKAPFLQQTQLLVFEFEKHFLCGEATAKSCEAAVAADHAMARNNDGNGIAPVRQTHRAHGFGIPDALRQVSVGNRFSVGNGAQGLPNAKLKIRPFQRQREIELLQFTAEISLQLADDFRKRRLVLLPAGSRGRRTLAALEAHQAQRIRIAREKQRPDRAIECRIKDRAHSLFFSQNPNPIRLSILILFLWLFFASRCDGVRTAGAIALLEFLARAHRLYIDDAIHGQNAVEMID